MRIQQHKFIQDNIKILRELTLKGYVTPTLLNYYDIYLSYMKIKKFQKMERYKLISIEKKCSPRTVRKAVYVMKQYINV